MSKLVKILAEAGALAEKIQSAAKKRDFVVSDHVSEQVRSGSSPNLVHLATTRDGFVGEIQEIFNNFLTQFDLSDVLSDKPVQEAGFPPVDEKFLDVVNDRHKTFEVVVVGKKPEVYIYLAERDRARCLRHYLSVTGVSADVFLQDPGYEVVVYVAQQLVANEVYRIMTSSIGSFVVYNKQTVVDALWSLSVEPSEPMEDDACEDLSKLRVKKSVPRTNVRGRGRRFGGITKRSNKKK